MSTKTHQGLREVNIDAGLTRLLVDLFLLALVIINLLYAVVRRNKAGSFYPLSSIVLLSLGGVVFVFAYLSEVIAILYAGGIGGFAANAALDKVDSHSTFWILSRLAFFLVLIGLGLGTWHRKKLERDVAASRIRVDSASDIIMQSESRFRHLFETTSNSIYCYTLDPPLPIGLPIDEQIKRSHSAILTECNPVFAQELEFNSPEEAIGTRFDYLDGTNDKAAHKAFFGKFVAEEYRLVDYELLYRTPTGEDRAVRTSLTGIVRNGELLRFWGAETDIQDLRQTRAALRRRRRFEELLTEISSSLVISSTNDADKTVTNCLSRVCRYIGSERSTVFWMDPQTKVAESAYTWSEQDDEFDQEISLRQYPNLGSKVFKPEVVRIDDVDAMDESMARDKKNLQRTDVKSFAAIPLVVGGDIVGVATHAHRHEARSWTDQDISELRVIAELFANFIHRLRAQRALDDAMSGLRGATARLEAENVYLRQEIERSHGFDEIIGESNNILHCLNLVEQVADTMTPVLILGETGTGKELIARAIHEHSGRRDRPLVKVNCAALPANLIESELFGYEKGAFTGADRLKRGRFDLANGSTLFLDEIGDIPIELQAKLLRALQEGEFERLGGSKTVRVDVRIVAATNRNVAAAVASGEFRSDLYYRINTFPIELPPLRDRGDDIQLLAENFVKVHSPGLGREVTEISAEMMRRLREYSWPGNVRELESVVQRALISSQSSVLELPAPIATSREGIDSEVPRVVSSTIADLRLVEREHILSILDDANWKISGPKGAAAQLGIPPSTLRSKMKKLSIERPH